MAHLLGSQYCIESLHSDVADLQYAVSDVLSRVGPIDVPSWKYPDKKAFEVDIEELLQDYKYCDNEEDRQVSHIILMELVIDRLTLLLQALSKFTDGIVTFNRVPSATHRQPANTSIGVVVKKFWAKMANISTITQQLYTESKSNSRKVSELEETVSQLTEVLNNQSFDPTTNTSNSNVTGRSSTGLSRPCSRTPYISDDACFKSTQTLETAFVPCEGCAIVQQNLRELGDVLVSTCNTQGLKSSLGKHRKNFNDSDWMTAYDVKYWVVEQNKDLSAISNHLEYLMSTIDPLKLNLEKSEDKVKSLELKVTQINGELRKERDTQSAQMKLFDRKLKETERKSADGLTTLRHQNQTLEAGKRELEKQLEGLQVELGEKEKRLKELEKAKKELTNELVNTKQAEVDAKQQELTVRLLEDKLLGVTEKLTATQRELAKEQSKVKSVGKHTSTLQGKQESLLSRIDQLDQENEELRNRVADLEDNQEETVRNLEDIKMLKKKDGQKLQEKERLVEELSSDKEKLQQSIEGLHDNITQLTSQIRELEEQEKLLMEYPDLNGPVNADFSGTGDIGKDMENQVKANTVRIQVLEGQNTKLRNTISKMFQTQSRPHLQNQLQSGPVPLWSSEALEDKTDQPSSLLTHANIHHKNKNTNLERGDNFSWNDHNKEHTKTKRNHVTATSSDRNNLSRPSSGKVMEPSAAAYIQLKKAGLLKGPQPKGKSRPISKTSQREAEVFFCPQCDRMFQTLSDLEIHQSYCYGGI